VILLAQGDCGDVLAAECSTHGIDGSIESLFVGRSIIIIMVNGFSVDSFESKSFTLNLNLTFNNRVPLQGYLRLLMFCLKIFHIFKRLDVPADPNRVHINFVPLPIFVNTVLYDAASSLSSHIPILPLCDYLLLLDNTGHCRLCASIDDETWTNNGTHGPTGRGRSESACSTAWSSLLGSGE
jgi:hypothetical protein